MINTQGRIEKFQGSTPSLSPTALSEGVFSLCSGGIPSRGAFLRLQGKTLRDSGVTSGSALSIYQLGNLVVIQKFTGLELHSLANLTASNGDFILDSNNQIVTNLENIPLTAT